MTRLRRFAPVVLALGVAAALTQVLPHLPHEREVELRLDDPSSITSVELAWVRAGDAVQGASWRFEPGKAPRSLTTTVRLPDGEYDVDIELARALEASEPTRVRRTITLADANRISLVLR